MNHFNPAVDDDKTEVDLTPMLDVVFIMLVFFIITASFIRESGIPVTLPGFGEPALDAVQSIVVTVKPESIFVVNDRVMSRGSLIPYVTALYAQNPEASFAVVVTIGSRVGDTVAAADAGRAVGFDVIPITVEE